MRVLPGLTKIPRLGNERMQHNEPGFGVALEQLRRTPDNHEAVSDAFARVTGGSPVWANVGAQLTKDPRRATELLGFTNEAAATHADDPHATELFNHYQREIGDAMHAYAQTGNAKALHHVADQMNDLFVHHLSAPLLGKAAVAAHMTDEELASYQTGIEASAFATPEMVGAWYNPKSWSKKKPVTAKASVEAVKTEKKGSVFSRAWSGTKKAVGRVVTSGKKKVQQKKDATAQALAQKIIHGMKYTSKLDILKNSRGNSASQVYAVAGQIRSLTGVTSEDRIGNVQKLFGKIPSWRLPVDSGYEGLGELGGPFTAMWEIGVKADFEVDDMKEKTWTMRDDEQSSPVDLLGFGSAMKLGHPKAQLFVWAYGDNPPEFTWNASAPISVKAVFLQETGAFSEKMKRFEFSAVTEAQNNFSYLGTTARSKFVNNDISGMDGYDDFQSDLDAHTATSVKVPGRKDPVYMLDGAESPAYKMYKNDGSLFVLDLVQTLLQRSAALTPRCRLYCKLKRVPKSWSATTAIEVQILAVTLEIQVQSIALGYEVVKHYKEAAAAQAKAGSGGSAKGAASSTANVDAGVVDGK